MKIGVIGAGNWGQNLVRNLFNLGALAAVADSSAKSLKNLEKDYADINLYDDYRALLSQDLHAVAIATPAVTHHKIAKEAILSGKDVFVEKPMTLSSVEAEELVALAAKNNRILMVGHLLLYQAAIQWIKDYLTSGRLGEIYSLHQERLNLGRARSVENALWCLGVHDVAVLLYLVGQNPDQINVSGHCILNPQIEDDVYLHLHFPGGVQAHLHNSWLWPEKERRLTIVGSKGMLVYDELNQVVLLYKKGINKDLSNRDEGHEVIFKGDNEPLKRELLSFLECVNLRKRPLSDGASGVEVIRILENATRLLKSGKIRKAFVS